MVVSTPGEENPCMDFNMIKRLQIPKLDLRSLDWPRFDFSAGQWPKMPELRIGDAVAKLPIIQSGMGVGISLSGLASAVANEGGYFLDIR
jgi:nitronate monooxygenase